MNQLSVIAALPGVVLLLSMLLSTYFAMRSRRRAGEREDEQVLRSEHSDRELSPVVEQLLGSAAAHTRTLRIPPRADQAGRVPSPGVLTVVGVDLPSGRPTRAVDDAVVEFVTHTEQAAAELQDGAPQLWVASRAGNAQRRWKLLAAGFAESGLWPVLLPPPADSHEVPSEEWFDRPARRHATDDRSAADHLRERLAESLGGGSPLTSIDRLRGSAVARGELSTGSGRRTDAVDIACGAVGSSRLALAPGRRPSDVLHAIAWPGAEAAHIPSAEFAQIVGSWEERWGALLVGLDACSLTLAILRPPATEQEALEALAELHALCPDQADEWQDDVTGARSLIDDPVWHLSWH